MRRTRATLALALLFATVSCRRGAPAGGSPPDGATVRARDEVVRDVTLHTVEVSANRGPLLLALHGGPGLDHTYLRPWLDPLGRTERLLYVDLRGHGRSSQPSDANSYTISAAAADLAALIAARSTSPADVIAHSFGAAVAMELAARHPEAVGRLVLVDPMRDAGQLRAMPQRTREAIGETGFQRVMELTTPEGTLRDPHAVGDLMRRLGRMWWHRPPSDALLRDLTGGMIYRPEADAHFLVDAARWDGRALAPEVRARTLVISGDDDHTFPSQESRALADLLPHGQFVEIPEAGHCPFIEQPDRFKTVVERFLGADGRPE